MENEKPQENNANIDVGMSGTGHAENLKTESVEDQALPQSNVSVDYGGGAGKNPMEELAEETGPAQEEAPATQEQPQQGAQEEPVAAPVEQNTVVEETPVTQEVGLEETAGELEQKQPGDELSNFDESKLVNEATLTQSNRGSGFNPETQQDGRMDRDDNEGGVMVPGSSGRSMGAPAQTDVEGGIIRPQSDMEKDSISGKFEITGFTVSYSISGNPGQNNDMHSIQVRDYFDDIDTAMMSVNGDSYLLAMPQGGFKKSKITQGAPIICYDERQVRQYKNGEWVRT